MSDYQAATVHSGDSLPSTGDDSFSVFFKTATDTQGPIGIYIWDSAWVLQRSHNWPVGAIYTSVDPTDPATLFGYGTWTVFGAGQVLVGYDSSDSDFNTVEATGGEKTHVLTVAEMPSHTHGENKNSATTGALSGFGVDTSTSTSIASGYSTAATGGDGAHNNLQPYIVVYCWKRTA